MIDHDEARLLLADLVIDDLADPSRLAELQAHVTSCDACRAELVDLRRLDALVRDAGPLATPSPELAARVAVLVTTPPTAQPGGTAGRGGSRRERGVWPLVVPRRVRWPLATAAAVALSVIVAAVVATSGAPGMTVTAHSRLVAAPNWPWTGGSADMGRLAGRRVLRVRVTGLPRLNASYYELWIAASPSDRISLGVLVPDANGRVDATIPLPQLPPGYRGVWITRQPQEGGPGWTNDWVLAQQV